MFGGGLGGCLEGGWEGVWKGAGRGLGGGNPHCLIIIPEASERRARLQRRQSRHQAVVSEPAAPLDTLLEIATFHVLLPDDQSVLSPESACTTD